MAMTGRSFLARLALDTSALRELPAFRRLCIGQLISLVGRQVTVVAVPFQVYSCNTFVACRRGVGLGTSRTADHGIACRGPCQRPVRSTPILLGTQLSLAACSGMLTIGAVVGHPPLVVLYAIVAVAAFVSAVDLPTRQAMIPGLFPLRACPEHSP